MKEAQLTCLTKFYRIQDMRLSMTRHEVVYVQASRAEASQDLKIARKAGAIEVLFVERSKEQREAPIGPVSEKIPRKTRKALGCIRSSDKRGADIRSTEVASQEVPRETLTKEQVSELVAARLADFKGDMAELLQEMLGSIALAQAPVAGTVKREAPATEDAPVFVPESIIGDQKADISVQEGEASGDDVNAAIEALKAARKKEQT